MEENLILNYLDLLIPPNKDENIISNMILLPEKTYYVFLQSIYINCLLFLFMVTCFSTIITCAQRDKHQYSIIPNSDIIEIKNDKMEITCTAIPNSDIIEIKNDKMEKGELISK